MRKILLVSFVVFAVILGASVAITWFLQANAIKKNIRQTIEAINETHPIISYETLETSGFPTDVVVSIVNPRFSGRMDQLLAKLDPSQTSRSLPTWTEDVTLNGDIMISANALSNEYSFVVRGNWVDNSQIAGQKFTLSTQSPANFTCVLKTGSPTLFGEMWNFNVFENSVDFLRDFRILDCNAAASTIVDASKNVIFSSGPQRIYVTNEPKGDVTAFRLYVKSADTEVTPAGDSLIGFYAQALGPDYPFSKNMSAYGKQNVEIDVTYNGPMDWNKTNPKDTPFSLNLNKFDINNKVYTSTMFFNVDHALQGDVHSGKLALKSESTFTEAYDAIVQDAVRQMIAEISHPTNPKAAALQTIIQKYTPEQWFTVIYPAVPNFHSLGKTVLTLDTKFQGNKDFTNGDIALDAFEISAAPYGLTGKGTAKITQGQLFPVANLTFVWTNCLRMIDDMIAYWTRVERVIAEIDPAKKPTFNPQLTEGIKTFMSALAETTTAVAGENTTYTYALVSDGGSNVTINGKKPEEVIALYNQFITPFLAKPAAAPQQ